MQRNVFSQGGDGLPAMHPRRIYSNNMSFCRGCDGVPPDSAVSFLRQGRSQPICIDSSGIGSLMPVGDRASREGKRLELINGNFKKILKLVNLSKPQTIV